MGFDEKAFEEVAKIISLALKNSKDEEKLQQAKERVAKLTAEYPISINIHKDRSNFYG